jgi:hypothetical protein
MLRLLKDKKRHVDVIISPDVYGVIIIQICKVETNEEGICMLHCSKIMCYEEQLLV